MKIVINKAVSVSFILGLIVGALGLMASGLNLHGTGMAVLSPNDAANKAINYINDNLVRQGSVSLVSVEKFSGVYKVTTSYMGQEIPVYVTEDGNFLFLSKPLNMSQSIPKPQNQQQGNFDAPDREKANIKFFVMAFCPFGNQAENGLGPVYKLLGDKVEWEPHYVIYSNYGGYPDYCLDENETYCSMHGIQELHEDIRELCIWKYYNHSTWWDFVLDVNKECNAKNADECWKPIAEKYGIDVTQVEQCVEQEGKDLLDAELKLDKKYNVRGSPTVFINDKQYSGARTPEAYKEAICSGFINPPAECNETLSGGTGSPQGQC